MKAALQESLEFQEEDFYQMYKTVEDKTSDCPTLWSAYACEFHLKIHRTSFLPKN